MSEWIKKNDIDWPDGFFLAAIERSRGAFEIYYVEIDENGDLLDAAGDSIGWDWNSVSKYKLVCLAGL